MWGLVLGIACGAARPPAPSGALAAADRALMQGCLACLRSAQASYRGLARREPALATRVFEADVLVALRERELGVPASDALVEARRLAPALPAAFGATAVLAAVDALPVAELASSREEAERADVAEPEPLRRQVAQSGLRAPVRGYLVLALHCRYSRDRSPQALQAPPGSPPLVAFRSAACGLGGTEALAALRAQEPRFVETSLLIAQVELALFDRDDARRVAGHVAEAVAQFPASPAAHYLAGTYALATEDDAGALAAFDRALALHAHHTGALLGKLTALSHLGRAAEAVDAATALIAISEYRRADGYYWRAYNHHALGHATEAQRDVAAAAELTMTAEIHDLSGVLAYERGELELAHDELTAALALDAERCDDRWYLATIAQRRKAWPDAGQAFEAAMTCYQRRAQTTQARRDQLAGRDDLEADYRARSIAAFDRSIAFDTRQQHVAAAAGASCAFTAGDLTTSRRLIELAGDEPAVAESIAKLRRRLAR